VCSRTRVASNRIERQARQLVRSLRAQSKNRRSEAQTWTTVVDLLRR
jgi:hypothetical protein